MGDPDFQNILNWSTLVFGIGMLAESLKEIELIKQEEITKILSFLQGTGIFIGFFFYMVWMVNLKEI